jgi:hypothetical protein
VSVVVGGTPRTASSDTLGVTKYPRPRPSVTLLEACRFDPGNGLPAALIDAFVSNKSQPEIDIEAARGRWFGRLDDLSCNRPNNGCGGHEQRSAGRSHNTIHSHAAGQRLQTFSDSSRATVGDWKYNADLSSRFRFDAESPMKLAHKTLKNG